MSKEKLSFKKLAVSGAVVAGCLEYCGVIGVGIATLSGSDALCTLPPQDQGEEEIRRIFGCEGGGAMRVKGIPMYRSHRHCSIKR
ncbi:MAG: hypothetical protein LBL30_01755 [Holosporales bacterium]|jgi:hypothetical protein|nr:hypothetical protein [Holosporales bacterium]